MGSQQEYNTTVVNSWSATPWEIGGTIQKAMSNTVPKKKTSCKLATRDSLRLYSVWMSKARIAINKPLSFWDLKLLRIQRFYRNASDQKQKTTEMKCQTLAFDMFWQLLAIGMALPGALEYNDQGLLMKTAWTTWRKLWSFFWSRWEKNNTGPEENAGVICQRFTRGTL